MKNTLTLLIVALLILIPTCVFADSGSVSITCSPNEVNKGGTTECTITGNISNDITSLSISISKSENVTIQSFKQDELWSCMGTCDASNGIDMLSASGDPVNGEFNIGKITFKISENNTNSSEKIEFTIDDQHLSHQITFVNAKAVVVPNTDSTISIIAILIGLILTLSGIYYITGYAKKA